MQHALDRNAGPARDDTRDVLLGHGLFHHRLARFLLEGVQAFFERGNDAVGKLARAGEIALALRDVELLARLVELAANLLRFAELVLLRLPARGELGGFLFQIGKLDLELLQALGRRLVALFLQSLALDLELNDAPVELVERLGLGVRLACASGSPPRP